MQGGPVRFGCDLGVEGFGRFQFFGLDCSAEERFENNTTPYTEEKNMPEASWNKDRQKATNKLCFGISGNFLSLSR